MDYTGELKNKLKMPLCGWSRFLLLLSNKKKAPVAILSKNKQTKTNEKTNLVTSLKTGFIVEILNPTI